MGRACMVWMGLLLAFLLMSSADAEYYNTQRLTTYLRLSQQLRAFVLDNMYDIEFRISNLLPRRAAKNATIMELAMDMYDTLNSLSAGLYSTSNRMNYYLAAALKVSASDPYPDSNALQFNVVDLDHGVSYSDQTGDSIILRSGVYLLEVKSRGLTSGLQIKLDVIGSDGSLKYSLKYRSMSHQPFMEMLLLDVGDRLDTKVFSEANLIFYGPPVPGPANQLNLRFLGEISA